MIRLDAFLFENDFTQSRNKAKELILSGAVLVDGKVITKPSLLIDEQKVQIAASKQYVSRAGDKLKNFLLENPIMIEGKRCLDIGASTGGFIEVLLEYGACEVVGVDVGRGQLHERLRSDSRVSSIEGCDIREFESLPFEVVTCDVSFVGSEYILPAIDRLSADDIIMLFKPQFEVGRDVKRDRKGVVKDRDAIMRAQNRFEEHFKVYHWKLQTKKISKVKGKEGNVEIFYHFKKR
jgi:23S rRNA (cytidine1920-2'-O)/16S rRNA (cytidine1409-2'-O)-methyltransferase